MPLPNTIDIVVVVGGWVGGIPWGVKTTRTTRYPLDRYIYAARVHKMKQNREDDAEEENGSLLRLQELLATFIIYHSPKIYLLL